MWLIVVALTLILWLLIDNILIAVILAIFAVYSYTLVRALYLLKKEETELQTVSINKNIVSSVSTNPVIAESTIEEEVKEILVDKSLTTGVTLETEEIDTSYLDFVQNKYK